MPVPFIDLSRLVRELRDEVLPAWTDCLDRCEFVGGPRVAALERELATALGVPRVVSCANGTDALIVGLQALGVRPGAKVALPNLTFWATYEAIVQVGAIPVLVDVDPADLQMSFDAFVSAHRAHGFTAATLVHLYGWASARLADFRAYCIESGVALLEDGAQSFGVDVDGAPVLAGATIGTTSFYPAKVVGGAMDGGAITVQSEEHEVLLRSLCNHGRAQHYSYARVGWNSRMSGLQAAFLSAVVRRLPAILASRRHAAAFYRKRLGGHANIEIFAPPAGVLENGYLASLAVRGKGGQEVVDALKARGIGATRTYPETMDAQAPAKGVAILHGDLSVSRRVTASIVNLPLFHGITDDECEEAAAALLDIAS